MTLSARRTNVLDATTPLVGRADALLELEERFAEGRRLVTVLGPVGVGKSRLALAFAAELSLAGHPGGVWRCDLQGCRSREELRARLQAVLLPACEPASASCAADSEDALRRAGAMFLLLDNVEAALPHLAPLLEHWLRSAPGLVCLVTSRERVGLRAEATCVLGPLSDEAAIALFRERCEAARRPSREPDPILLQAIVRRLDCLPLALELAAEHARALDLAELHARLDPSLPFLSSSDRAGAPRTRSLRAALNSTLGVLSASELRAWLALSQFHGEFALTDAEAAFEDPSTPTAVVLTRLCERSLLWVSVADGRSSFRMPRATREYASELFAQQPEASRLRARFAAALLRSARRYLDHENDVAALSWLCRHSETLLASARASLAAAELEPALEALVAASHAAAFQGPVEPALALLQMAPLEATRDEPLRCRALRARGRLRARHGQLSSALADFEAARERAALAAAPEFRVSLAIDLGNHHRHQADWLRAASYYDEGLQLCASHRDVAGRARVLAAMAGMAHERGELLRARELFESALCVTREHALPLVEATILQNLGTLLQELGRRDDAAACFRRAIAAHRALAHRRFEGIAEYDLASLALEQDAVGEAKAGFARAVELAAQVGDRRELGLSLALLGVCQALTQQLESAARQMDAAESLLRALGQPGLVLAVDIHRAHLELAQGLRELDGGDARAQRERLERVREALCRARVATSVNDAKPGVAGDEARYALRVLEAAYRRQAALGEYALVDSDGRWFQPAGGERVDLRHRVPLQRLLSALIQRRMHAPDEPVPVEELIRAGWPDERAVTKAAKNRLHVAVTTLRKSGLDPHLVHSARGYHLARTVPWHSAQT